MKSTKLFLISLILFFNLSYAQVEDVKFQQKIENILQEFKNKDNPLSIAVLYNGNTYNTVDTINFRVASITKVVTSLAIYQLEKSNRLSFDDSLNEFLDIRCNMKSPTISQLLTHTSGFDNSDINDAYLDETKQYKLKDYAAKTKLKQTFKPGLYYRYSNYNYVLLGLIIEKITGKLYEQAIKELVFENYNLKNSTFKQTSQLWPKISDDWDLSKTISADGLTTKSTDMLNLISGLLNNSIAYDFLFEPKFYYDKALEARSLTFNIEPYGKTRKEHGASKLYHHLGNRPYFNSELILIPDKKLGVYISGFKTSSPEIYQITSRLIDSFAPGQPLKLENKKEFETSVIGNYKKVNINNSTLEKFGGLLRKSNFIKLNSNNGNLNINNEFTLNPRKNNLFRLNESGQIIALKNYNNQPHVFVGLNAYKSISVLETRMVQMLLYFVSTIGIFILSLLILKKRTIPKSIKFNVIFQSLTILLITVFLFIAAEQKPDFDYGLPIIIKFIRVLIWAFIVFVLMGHIMILMHRLKTFSFKYTLLSLFQTIMVSWFIYWNLV